MTEDARREREALRATLRDKFTDLRVSRAPIRPHVRQDMLRWATILAGGIVSRSLRSTRHADDLVPVPWTALVSTGREPHPFPSPQRPEPLQEPPADPDEGVRLPDQMPQTAEEWSKAAKAASDWRAGHFGPVDIPFVRDLPDCPAGHVLMPAGAARRLLRPLPEDDEQFLLDKTAEELTRGGVELVTDPSKLRVVCPVHVAEHPTTSKRRMVFDARGLNAFLQEAAGSVTYESVRDALLQTAGCMTKIDLASAFRHVRLTERASRCMGFAVGGRVFRYRALPFGCSWSPALFAAMLEPTIAKMRRAGLKVVWYVDDIAIFGNSVAELDAATAAALRTLREAGWQVAPDKVFVGAYVVMPFLGLLVDLRDPAGPVLRVPVAKANRIAGEAEACLDRGYASLTALRKIAGRMEFAVLVIPHLALLRQPLDAAVATAMKSAKPSKLSVDSHLHQTLCVIAARARGWPRHSTPPGGQVTLAVEDASERAYSDASAFGWGVLRTGPGGPFVPPPHLWHPPLSHANGGFDVARGWTVGGKFSAAERALSSAAREIRAITYGVLALGLRHVHVAWFSDATAAVQAVKRGRSRAAGVAVALIELFEVLEAHVVILTITHCFRSCDLMPVADYLSRRAWRDGQAEWSFDRSDVRSICSALQTIVSADLFASQRNRVRAAYASRFLEIGSLGDAFFLSAACLRSQSWWVFPPFRVVDRWIGHIARLAEAAAAVAESSPAAAPHPYVSFVLIRPEPSPSDVSAARWSSLCRLAASPPVHVTVWAPTTAAACVLPNLRLRGWRGRPAPGPPPCGLHAYRLCLRI